VNDMIERVARVLQSRDETYDVTDALDPCFMDSARAAIAAMREPTKEMEAMGWAYHSEIGRMELPAAYTRMIDAALEETK